MHRRRRTRAFVFAAAAAALAGTIALPATPAGAAGEQLSAAPATNVGNGDSVQVTLSGASAENGQTVYFAECGVPGSVVFSGDAAYCGTFQPQGGVTVANGAAAGAVTAVYGAVGSGASCTSANNGGCTVAAFVNGSSGPTKIASTPISFAAPQTTALSVTPSTNLDDGDAVAVSLTGIPSGVASVNILQCHGEVPVTMAQTSSCKNLVYFGAVSNHAYSGSAHVIYGPIFGAADPSGPRCDETANGHCAIAAVDSASSQVLGSTAISFEAPQTGMTVTPDTGLKDKQPVTVTNTGIPASAGDQLQLVECNTAYAAAHGGYGATRAGCDFNLTGIGTFQRGTPVSVNVVDGPSADGAYACNHANNGDCALVILSYGVLPGGGYGYTEVMSHPITFRPPVLGLATIAATPTTGLYLGKVGTLSVKTTVPDGVDNVDLVECRPAGIDSFTGDWYYRACAQLKTIKVVNNSFAPQTFKYAEGGIGGEGSKPCDHTHPCEIGLSTPFNSDKNVLLSNWIPISFRKANFGTPTIKLSKNTGLQGGDKINLSVTDVPDLVRALAIMECNVKGGYDRERCVGLTVKPRGDVGLFVSDNKSQGSAKIKEGLVGNSISGKKVYCNAKTNGQCVLVAIMYPGYKYLVKSPVIKFKP